MGRPQRLRLGARGDVRLGRSHTPEGNRRHHGVRIRGSGDGCARAPSLARAMI